MLIVLEGVDATGKTTLAEELVEKIGQGAELKHYGPPEKHPLDEWALQLEHFNPRTDHWVMDRFHWGELVYAPHYRGKTELGWYGLEWMEQLIVSRGGVTIRSNGELNQIFDRVVALNDDYVEHDIEHLAMLNSLYDDVVGHCRTPLYQHDIDVPDGVVNQDVVLTRARHLASQTLDFPGYIGHRHPSVLFVGEQANTPHSELPFMPYPNTCGRYLIESVLQTPWGEKGNYGLVNALTLDGAAQGLVTLWHDLGQPRVVALGNIAHSVLTKQAIPHGMTYHPQYVRRFHHDSQGHYANSMTKAAVHLDDTRRLVK